MGGFACSMDKVPRIRSYDEARDHYDSVDKRFDYGGKPIKGALRYSNMRMRREHDGSYVFRFYDTDCVTYHPDRTVTIIGYDSMSTTAFIGQLAPDGVTHAKGRKMDYEPILHLRMPGEYWWINHPDGSYSRNTDVLVVKCSHPVKLYYCADAGRWLPLDRNALDVFEWITIDRGPARKAAKRYHLGEFVAAVPALHALGQVEREEADVDEALARLEKRDFLGALAYCSLGEVRRRAARMGGREECITALQSRFLERMRNRIYDQAGALSLTMKPVLTISEYGAYCNALTRFDD